MTSSAPIPVSVIVLTHDEAANIARCLGALAGFEDLIVVDSGSTDGTPAIVAERFPSARVFSHPFEDFGAQRNWALDETSPRHEWVLFVDADEFMEPPLTEEIAALVASPGDVVGGFISGRNYFLGRWLKHCTFYPSYQLRLLRRGRVRYRREGHGQREVTDGRTTYLRHGWRHEGFSKGLEHWIARHNRYSTAEVPLIVRLRRERMPWSALLARDPIRRRRALKVLGAKLPGRPLTRFLYTFVLRRGFLDGHRGLIFCLLRLAHDCHIVAKRVEADHLARERRRAERQA